MATKAELEHGESLEDAVATGNVIINYWAPWCGPCRILNMMIAPILESLPENVTILMVDVDEHMDSVTVRGIRSVPTLVFMQNGEEKEHVVGAISEKELRDRVAAAFGA